MWRDLYQAAVNPETFFDGGHLRSLMAQVTARQETAALSLDDALGRISEWNVVQRAKFTDLCQRGDEDDREHLIRALLVHSTPMASVLGCWLQGFSAPGVFEDEIQLRLMALLADDAGVGRPDASRYAEFRLLLRRLLLTEPALESHQLASVRKIHDEMFALPAVLQAASRRADRFMFELVGVDCALRTVGLLPGWAALRPFHETAVDWRRLDLSAASGRTGVEDPLAVAIQVARACAELDDEARGQVAAGAAWIAAALDPWNARLLDACESALDPERAMAALISTRAREAAIYHHDFALEGRSLSSWLRESLRDPFPLVRALARSKLVRPGESARSPLVGGLVGVRGPMFRIFSPEDLDTIRRWIDHLPAARDEPVRVVSKDSYPEPEQAPPAGADEGATPANLREAYHMLQGRALAPRTRAFAFEYVTGWLEVARRSLDRSGHSLPPEWTTAGLRPWLRDQHDRHDLEFTKTESADLPSREDVIDSTLQLAPLTLIDGSWLQGFTDVNLASSRIGSFLLETYWDELGNGQIRLNHPTIYRNVLRQMGIELPPTGSREFAFDERIREESLRLPVYWLSLGKLPVTFFPEILGMNLAMELSGVGGSYRSARRFLKHYGFSTQFVDIHNTIDNVSTGHSAWAADAVDTYLRERVNLSDPKQFAADWERIRVGYESLSPVPPKRGVFERRRRRPHTAPTSEHLMHHRPIRMSA